MTAWLDQRRVLRAFDRAAARFDSQDFLNREIDARLRNRLDVLAIEPGVIIDIGAGTAAGTRELQARFPAACVVALDAAPAMLTAGAYPGAICANAAALPIIDGSVDLVFSNLLLPFCADPIGALREMRRVLRRPGAALLSSFGPDTLIELQRAWRDVDEYHHVLPFMDMHDLGDALVQAGFAEPVLDAEIMAVTYRDLDRGLKDLRAAGSINACKGRNRGLTGRNVWNRLRAALEQQRNKEQLLPVTIEVVYALAWAGEPGQARRPDGSVEIPLERLLRGIG